LNVGSFSRPYETEEPDGSRNKEERTGWKQAMRSFLSFVGIKNSEVPDNHAGGEFQVGNDTEIRL
jgi:hypothetical protein